MDRSAANIPWISTVSMLLVLLPAHCVAQQKEGASRKSKREYTCPMHPQVVIPDAGRCPICGMELVAHRPPPKHLRPVKVPEGKLR